MDNPTCQFKDCYNEGYHFSVVAYQRYPRFLWLCQIHTDTMLEVVDKLLKEPEVKDEKA